MEAEQRNKIYFLRDFASFYRQQENLNKKLKFTLQTIDIIIIWRDQHNEL